MAKILLKNGEVFYEDKIQNLDILIENDLIVDIAQNIVDKDAKIIDVKHKLVSLGFVDMHTHLREPGFTKKETIKSGTLSAIYGGYTHIVAMANTNPCMDNLEIVKWFSNQAKLDSYVNLYTYVAISKDLMGRELVDIKSLSQVNIIKGFSDDGKGIQDGLLMEKAMGEVKSNNSLIVAHCEDESELKANGSVHQGVYAQENGLVGINSASEYLQVKRDLELAKQTKVKYHICHVSTKQSVELIKKAKMEGVDVSAEVTPHHLILSDDMIKEPITNYKMNPPLRSSDDRQRLIQGLNEGVIEIIATDHAPHTKKEKCLAIDRAPFGIIGLQWAFPLLYTKLVKTGLVQLQTLLNALTTNPSARLSLEHRLETGQKANLVIIDLEQEFMLNESDLVSKSSNTPFIGERCFGKVELVCLNGEIINLGGNR